MIGIAATPGVIRSLASAAVLTALTACGGSSSSSATAPSQTQPNSNITEKKIEESLASARAYIERNELSKAQAILVTLIDRSPREVRARELQGQVLTLMAMEAQRAEQAEVAGQCRARAYEQYRAAVEIDPDSPGLNHSAGMMAMAAGRSDEALRHFEAAERLDPDNPQHPLFQAQLLIGMREYEQATQAIHRALTLDPDEPLAHATLAMIALEQNRFDDALKAMTEARRIDPTNLDLRAQEARIHRRKGDPNRAIELLAGLNATQRGKEIVAYELATSYSDLKQHLKAADAWQRCYTTNASQPESWRWAVRVGQALLKAGERDQAARWLQQAQFAAPNAPEVISLRSELAK